VKDAQQRLDDLHWRQIHASIRDAWQLNALFWRLAAAADTMVEPHARAKGAMVTAFALNHSRPLRRFARDFLATSPDGEFLYRVEPDVADKLWSSTPIVGGHSLPIAGDLYVRTLLADLTRAQCRQVDALAHLILTALFANAWPTSIALDGPTDPCDPGDIVGGFKRLPFKRAQARGVNYSQNIHAKGVACKTLGTMGELYGRWRWQAVRTLVELATGVRLTDREMQIAVKTMAAQRKRHSTMSRV
jgi:hypothetical protein